MAAKKSAIELGAKQAVRTVTKRTTKKVINKTQLPPVMKLAAIAALGAIASYFINKK